MKKDNEKLLSVKIITPVVPQEVKERKIRKVVKREVKKIGKTQRPNHQAVNKMPKIVRNFYAFDPDSATPKELEEIGNEIVISPRKTRSSKR